MTNPNNLQQPEIFDQEIVTEVQTITSEATPGGVLYAVAEAKAGADTSERGQYLPQDVYDIVVPRKTSGSAPPRYELIDQAPTKAKEAAAANRERIFALAEELGLRRDGDHEDFTQIDPQRAIMVVEDGANKTSIVRRHIAAQALQASGAVHQRMYQLGSDRIIAPIKHDKEGAEVPNPEHTLLRSLAGEFLPEGSFDSFSANLATALAEGYDISSVISTDPSHQQLDRPTRLAMVPNQHFSQALELAHPDTANYPPITLIRPTVAGLVGGLSAVASLQAAEGTMVQGSQIVVATNGQYRPMKRLQAHIWGQSQEWEMQPPVALGDEPGDRTPFKDQVFETAARSETAYLNELALYGREATAYALAHTDQTYSLPGSVTIQRPDGEQIVYEPNGSSWSHGHADGIWYASPTDPGQQLS